MTKEELIILLTKYSIPFQNWGTGNAKTLDHLLKEINSGESSLAERDGGLIRIVSVIVMNVYFNDGNRKLKLFEDRQEYKFGRIVKRNNNDSLLEKIKPDEDISVAAKRTLAEEINITPELNIIDKGTSTEMIMGKSFPGLLGQATLYNFEVELTENEFNPEGYIEYQEEKTNFYKWKINK